MSLAEHYTQRVPCPEHPGCHLRPYERCLAATSQGDRCRNRAAPSSIYCAAAHNGPNWHPGIARFRRGHPLEVAHHQGRIRESKAMVGVLLDRSMEMLTAWGPLNDEQIEVATEGAMSLDEFLEDVLAGE